MSEGKREGQEGPRGFRLVGDPETGEDRDPITFTTFVLSLSASGLLHLGVHPEHAMGIALDESAPPDLPACQQMIDILEMLRRKTRGNLAPEESRLLESVLHELHMRFVAARQAGA
jgi:hypothetical protein